MTITQFSYASIDHPDRCEDAVLALPNHEHAPVYAVIDGMGGHQHATASGTLITGYDAAQLVRETLIKNLSHLSPDIDASSGSEAEARIMEALTQANAQIRLHLNGGEDLPLVRRVGAVTTVVVVCESGKRILCMQVGDTRGYVFSDGELFQLCADEDNVEYCIREGIISAADAARVTAILDTFDGISEPKVGGVISVGGNSYELYIAWRWFVTGNAALGIPASNTVLNALGLYVDLPVVQSSRIEVAEDDLLLLCSDGLYKNLSEHEIVDALCRPEVTATTLGEAAVARYKDSANRRSTRDDVSVVTIQF